MAGTVILTGANGSAGVAAAEHLLKTYPEYTAIFTVRSAAEGDVNTKQLRDVIAKYPQAKATIHELDLSKLSAVHEFANTLSSAFGSGQYPPLRSIICNAFYWNLVENPQLTGDGFEKGIQIAHISHVALILRLLDHFDPNSPGSIELISGDVHYRKKNPMSPYLPEIPSDLDLLVHPPSVEEKDRQSRGFQRYATSKLVMTTWLHALNRYLLKDPKFKNIAAVALDPGSLIDSRAFRTNTPNSIQFMQKWVLKPLVPVIRVVADRTFRYASDGGVDMVELAVGKAHSGERGYFKCGDKVEPDAATLDEETQNKLWVKSAEWAGINKDNTALKVAFE